MRLPISNEWLAHYAKNVLKVQRTVAKALKGDIGRRENIANIIIAS
jgi:hypothetical protein